MKNLKTQIKITMVLGILALVSGVFAHLALTDIFHLEADVSLEWSIVRGSAVILVLFIVVALITLRRSLYSIPD
jgi:hypothetical protein